MPKEKMIYTITKTTYEEGDMTHRYEQAFEILYDALRFIGVWSNMKTMNGYIVDIYVGNDNFNEHCYIAEKTDDNNWVMSKEEIVLRKISLKLKEES